VLHHVRPCHRCAPGEIDNAPRGKTPARLPLLAGGRGDAKLRGTVFRASAVPVRRIAGIPYEGKPLGRPRKPPKLKPPPRPKPQQTKMSDEQFRRAVGLVKYPLLPLFGLPAGGKAKTSN
jgi:hypothetical protein